MPWYSMTAIYHWEATGSTLPKFERRTTICSASDEQSAESKLMKEAEEYQNEHIKILDNYTTQEIDSPPSEEPIEVAHEMTIGVDPDSGAAIEPTDFIRRHWNVSRITSCDQFGFEHSWHNRDGATSACYNCDEVREGQLWKTSTNTESAEQDAADQPPARRELKSE